VAEQDGVARRTALAKGEVGIRDRKPVTKSETNTIKLYKNSIEDLNAFRKWTDIPLDDITPELCTHEERSGRRPRSVILPVVE
jgi:hypothetical protein